MDRSGTRFVLIVFLWIVWAGAAYGNADFTGTWVLDQQSVGDAQVSPTPAKTLLLTSNTYHALILNPDICAASGPFMVSGDQMKVQIQQSSCLEPETPGSNLLFTYELDNGGERLTLTLARQDHSIVEIYKRSRKQTEQACRHPYCGIYNRVSTSVDGQLVNTEPAYTVITDTDYYSITRVCFNLCSIDQVVGNQITMTMQSHNCPVGPVDPQPPGTVITSTWKRTDSGRTLINNDSRFGAMVTTEFTRLN